MAETRILPFPIREEELPNGLRVAVVPLDSPGVLAYWTVVRAGSRDEVEPGRSGFAHFFEHMMFRGTARYSREAYNTVLKDLGADHNAFTSDDYTAYHILAPSSALDTLMTIEADRFKRLDYSVEDFKKEAGAVLGEYNKNAANPLQTLHEKLREAAFSAHTYKHATIGFLQDIRDMPNQFDYSRTFFDRFYRPENCHLLVVGDVRPEEVLTRAADHYGDWKRGSWRSVVPPEPRQKAPQDLVLDWPEPTQPYLYGGYHVPAFTVADKSQAALDLVGQLLFSEAAPLYQRLVVEEQKADFLIGGADDHRDPYLFTFQARVKKESDVASVLAALTEALEGMSRREVEGPRLREARSHIRYAFAMSLDTPSHVARHLAHYLALTGETETVNRLFAMYERITPEDVREIAAACFVPAGRTVSRLRQRPGP